MPEQESKSFWTTLPGLITAIAGLITAIGGFLLILNQIGVFDTQNGFEDGNGSPGVFSPKVSLSVPRQISPAPGEVFSHYPRRTTLTWEAVSGALGYGVEVQFCQSRQCTEDNATDWDSNTNISTTSYSFDFVGAQPGRWRVWAIGVKGETGPKSLWREFRYTQ